MTDFLTNADHWRKRAELTRALAANAVKDQGRLLKVAEEYDRLAEEAGLVLKERWSTWHRDPWDELGNYAVSVHHLHRG